MRQSLIVFKRASRLGNFTNIAFSLAQRHQRLQCWELASDSLLKSPIECGPSEISANTSMVCMQPIQIRKDFESLLGGSVNPDTVVPQPDWVKSGDILIKPGAYFNVGADGIYPMFGKVINIQTT